MPIVLSGSTTLPALTLLLDLTGTPFGATPAFSDYTSDLLTGGDGSPVNITWGAQREQTEPQPRTCSFLLDNTSGRWTPGNPAADVDWDVGVPVQLQVGSTARFTGYVDAIQPTWPGGVQTWSVVQVTATDVAARAGRAKPLSAAPVENAKSLGVTALYRLNDPAENTVLSNTVASGTPGVLLRTKAAGGAFDLGSGTTGSGNLIADPSTTLTLDPVRGATENAAGYYVRTATATTGPMLTITSAGLTVAGWISTTEQTNNNFSTLFMQHDGTTAQLVVWLVPDSVVGGFYIRAQLGGAGLVTSDSPTFVPDGTWHRWLVTVTSKRTLRLYFDSATYGPAGTLPSDAVWQQGVSQTWGGATLPAANNAWGSAPWDPTAGGSPSGGFLFAGSMAHLSVWNRGLTAAEVLADFQAGTCFAGERSDQRFARVASYVGVTATGLPAGQAFMGPQQLEGVSALQALQTVARTEGTAAFTTGSGAFTFTGRNARYQQTVGLTLPTDALSSDVNVSRDREGLANQLTVNNAGGASQTVLDVTSQTKHGRFDGGSFDVAANSDDDALQNAYWQVGTSKNPMTRLQNLTVDLLAQTDATIVSGVLAATVGSKVQVTGLPSQAPAATMTLFVEGGTETIGVSDWHVSFTTSPVTLEDSVWVLEDATHGAIDSTNVLAF